MKTEGERLSVMLIAYGPLISTQTFAAFRVVLRKRYCGGYAVHREFFPNYPSPDDSYYGDGEYFRKCDLFDAMRKFASEIARHADWSDNLQWEAP